MKRILVLKTAALGDVLRTTSILPGLAARHGPCRITWVTAPEAVDLIARHPSVDDVRPLDVADTAAAEALGEQLARERFDLVVSFDDEEPLCRLASAVGGIRLVGAYRTPAGERAYTDDSEPWFGMGLLARAGRAEADRRKLANRRSHAAILGSILDVEPARPELPLDAGRLEAAADRIAARRRHAAAPVVGLNTGAGGRWKTKALPTDRTIELIALLHERMAGDVTFLLFGGAEEAERNRVIRGGVVARHVPVDLVDTGTDNDLLDFAALISQCDVLVTSDSLGMHVAIARQVPVVAFFAPTSAAEIELFGPGEKIASTAPDYCSYRPDADNATITPERLADGVARVLAIGSPERRQAGT